MNINHISVSRKKCYETCAAQYKFRYHLKVLSPEPEPFYFIYGKIVHKIAELYVQNKGEVSIGTLAKDVLRGKIEIERGQLCPELPAEYQNKFQKHLRAIQNLTNRIGTDGTTEYEFRYDLDPPHGRFVTGFIDRLILRENKAFIIDYKTTKKGPYRVDLETVKEDLQLRTYARVIQREFGIPAENIKAALFYLEGENLVACQYSAQSLAQVEDDLKNAHIEIQAADPDKVWGNVGLHCRQCAYSTICQFYNSSSGSNHKWDGNLDSLGHQGW